MLPVFKMPSGGLATAGHPVAGLAVAVLALILVQPAHSASLRLHKEVFTTNAICLKRNCVNPIFPGLEDLTSLSESRWLCSRMAVTAPHMGFCRAAVTYDPAIPAPDGGSADIKAMVERQDTAAATAFVYHLGGLGIDHWDYTHPEFSNNDCIKSIWRMVCFTYFPRAAVGCLDGALTSYFRPCQSSCFNYIRSCNVECCDESVQCSFTHTKQLSATVKVTTHGYEAHDGPSSMCTGGAKRQSSPLGLGLWTLVLSQVVPSLGSFKWLTTSVTSRRLLWTGSLMLLAASLQGCDYDVPTHSVGNWRGEPDYLIKNQFIPPGGHSNQGTINSCSLERLSQVVQCSGRGVCKLWEPDSVDSKLSFCECDRDYADPECRTKRKSQIVAFALSVCFGMLGFDQFYLGFPITGTFKLLSLGGFGIWWAIDFIRIGSAPVYAGQYKVAADLPHWGFVLVVVTFAMLIGFTAAFVIVSQYRAQKKRLALQMYRDDEAERDMVKKPFASAYGPAKPVNMIAPPMAGLPPFAAAPYGTMAGGVI